MYQVRKLLWDCHHFDAIRTIENKHFYLIVCLFFCSQTLRPIGRGCGHRLQSLLLSALWMNILLDQCLLTRIYTPHHLTDKTIAKCVPSCTARASGQIHFTFSLSVTKSHIEVNCWTVSSCDDLVGKTSGLFVKTQGSDNEQRTMG